MKGQTQTPCSQLWSQPGAQKVGSHSSERLSRVTVIVVSLLAKRNRTVANTASCLVSVSASAAITEEAAPLCVYLGLN